MSCPHGNHVDACDLCDEVDAAWDRGYNAAIEKAAKVCASDESGRDGGGYFADQIRALKRHQPQRERNGQ